MTEYNLLKFLLEPKSDPYGKIISTTTEWDYAELMRLTHYSQEIVVMLRQLYIDDIVSLKFQENKPKQITITEKGIEVFKQEYYEKLIAEIKENLATVRNDCANQ